MTFSPECATIRGRYNQTQTYKTMANKNTVRNRRKTTPARKGETVNTARDPQRKNKWRGARVEGKRCDWPWPTGEKFLMLWRARGLQVGQI